jgi:cytochrome P450
MTGDREESKMMIDLWSDAAFQCPYPLYEKFQREEPISYYEQGGFYLVTRMADIKTVLSKPDIFSNEVLDLVGMGPALREVTMPTPALLFADPPRHARTRSLVDRAFTAPRVKLMENRIQAILDGLFDSFIGSGEVEVMSQIAIPLPIDFIARELDVPISERDRFKRWSDALANAFNPTISTDNREKLAPVVEQVNAYMLAKRQQKLQFPTQDIISVIATARVGEAGNGGELLSDGEYLTVAQQLIIAGNENTTAAIVSSTNALARSPQLFALIKADRKLIANFIEEILRLEGPASGFVRLVTRDTELGGVHLPKDSIVHIRYAAANRDPEQFNDPGSLDLTRGNRASHLAFGGGTHACLGQMLARKEMSCTIQAFCDRMSTIAVASNDRSRYTHNFHLRSLDTLRLTFEVA